MISNKCCIILILWWDCWRILVKILTLWVWCSLEWCWQSGYWELKKWSNTTIQWLTWWWFYYWKNDEIDWFDHWIYELCGLSAYSHARWNVIIVLKRSIDWVPLLMKGRKEMILARIDKSRREMVLARYDCVKEK